jgi:hypothetical protein
MRGRIDDRRGAYRAEQAPEEDLRQLLVSVTQQYRQVEAERNRLSDTVAILRAVAMQLRIRNDAVKSLENTKPLLPNSRSISPKLRRRQQMLCVGACCTGRSHRPIPSPCVTHMTRDK